MTNDEVGRMLAEFRTELAELRTLLLQKIDSDKQSQTKLQQELHGLHAKLKQLQPSLGRRDTPGSLLADLGKQADVLTLLRLDLPHHLRPVYSIVLDHGLVTAETVSEETGLSTSHASAVLKALAVEYGLLDWRKGDKKKGESTRTFYYYPVESGSPATASQTSTDESNSNQSELA